MGVARLTRDIEGVVWQTSKYTISAGPAAFTSHSEIQRKSGLLAWLAVHV